MNDRDGKISGNGGRGERQQWPTCHLQKAKTTWLGNAEGDFSTCMFTKLDVPMFGSHAVRTQVVVDVAYKSFTESRVVLSAKHSSSTLGEAREVN